MGMALGALAFQERRKAVPSLACPRDQFSHGQTHRMTSILSFEFKQALSRYEFANRVIVLFEEGFAVSFKFVMPKDFPVFVAHSKRIEFAPVEPSGQAKELGIVSRVADCPHH